jgi:hypothetical protein
MTTHIIPVNIARRASSWLLSIVGYFALFGSYATASSILGSRSANWLSKGSDVAIGSSWEDLATGRDKHTILAIGYKKGWVSCSSAVSFLIFSGRSIGKSTKERMSKSYSQQLELVVNGRKFTGKTQINNYPNNGLELAIETPAGLIAELSRSNNVLVRLGGNPDPIIQWTYGSEFVRENRRAMEICN